MVDRWKKSRWIPYALHLVSSGIVERCRRYTDTTSIDSWVYDLCISSKMTWNSESLPGHGASGMVFPRSGWFPHQADMSEPLLVERSEVPKAAMAAVDIHGLVGSAMTILICYLNPRVMWS
jgi:hypothetical protein